MFAKCYPKIYSREWLSDDSVHTSGLPSLFCPEKDRDHSTFSPLPQASWGSVLGMNDSSDH